MRTKKGLVAAAFFSVLLLGRDLSAAPITVVNGNFEADGAFAPNPGNFTIDGSGLTGWIITGSGPVGLFHGQGFFRSFLDSAGTHVAFSHGPDISQVLTAVLTPNTRYTLKVAVGDGNNTSFSGYEIRLLAGGVLLAQDLNTLTPNAGFIESIVTYDALPGDSQLGQPLEIVLDSFGPEVSWDFVRLDASPITAIPEPPTFGLLGVGLLGW